MAQQSVSFFNAIKNGDFAQVYMLMTLNYTGQHYCHFRDSQKHASVLHWACYHGHIDIVALLLHKFDYLNKKKSLLQFDNVDLIFKANNELFVSTIDSHVSLRDVLLTCTALPEFECQTVLMVH